VHRQVQESLAIYVHIPYCVKKCPYCDFNSYAASSFPEERYVDGLIKELQFYLNKENWLGRDIYSIFFGGGTPSLFSADSIGKILTSISKETNFLSDIEVTLEANPGTVYEELGLQKLVGFKAAGVNRISFGAQSFNANKLKFLGRIHAPDDTRKAVANVVKAGFSNFNLDLISGIAIESISDWDEDLKAVLALEPKHISAYTLTIEPGTEFHHQERKGVIQSADENTLAEMYQYTQQVLSQNGYAQYEISNYCQPGYECRHNLHYWRAGDYLGLGAGAHSHSKIESKRWSNIPGPTHYMERIESEGTAQQRVEQLSPEQKELEFLFLNLRTASGISKSDYQQQFQKDIELCFEEEINRLSKEDLLSCDDKQIKLTTKGFLFSDYVFSAFAKE